ncbi:MAG: murQ [Alphaproteobacteria bacterium]|nr:murQ [Alphaproteobacteria bacterium]
MNDANKLHATERLNEAAQHCHAATVLENLLLLNAENAGVHVAVAKAIPAIERLVETAIRKMRGGGRLVYIGAGTSGRLGVLDASECPPTYGIDPELVQAIIAGGDHALRHAAEGGEDDAAAGIAAAAGLFPDDILVGISASGSAIYVREAVKAARARAIFTAAICTAPDAPLLDEADCAILAPTNAEIPAGSTRMFSGTAQKMILNMITTTIMIGLGKVYGGYMIDVKTSNIKLRQRAVKMIATLAHCTLDEAEKLVTQVEIHTQNPVKPALVMHLERTDYAGAMAVLKAMDGRIDALMKKHGLEV